MLDRLRTFLSNHAEILDAISHEPDSAALHRRLFERLQIRAEAAGTAADLAPEFAPVVAPVVAAGPRKVDAPVDLVDSR